MGAAASISDIAELGTEFEALKEKLQPEEVEALQKAFDEAELKGKGEGTTKGFVFGTSDPFSLVIPHSLYLKLTFPLASFYSFIFLLSLPTNLLHHPSHRPSVQAISTPLVPAARSWPPLPPAFNSPRSRAPPRPRTLSTGS